METSVKHPVLFVDDEPNVLKAFHRNLRKDFEIATADSGAAALELLKQRQDFSVIVSDMRMPNMDGIEFFKQAKSLRPCATRIMLTGNADQKTAIDAINKGDIFRFINKPSNPDEMTEIINLGIAQYKLKLSEQEMLENTLKGSISALSETLALASPEIFGRTNRSKQHMKRCTTLLGVQDTWLYEALAMMCLVGCVSLPPDIIRKVNAGTRLDERSLEIFSYHTELGHELLMKIPRMDELARAVRYQNKNYDGTGYPEDEAAGKDIPVAARLLKIILDYDLLDSRCNNQDIVLQKLYGRINSRYDPQLLKIFEKSLGLIGVNNVKMVKVGELRNTMTLAQDIETRTGTLLLCKGQDISDSVKARIMSFYRSKTIGETVYVSEKATPGAKLEDPRV